MSTHNTIPEALRYVARLSMQIEGMHASTVEDDDKEVHLHMVNGRTITVKAGEPQRDYWMYNRPERMEQITIKAPRSKRSHGYAVDQARTFKVRKDGTLNGAGILNAIRTFVEHMAHVDRMERIQLQDDRDRNDLRLRNKAKLAQAGIEFPEYSSAARLSFSDISVKVEASASGVEITLPGLSPETALAILRNLGIVAKATA